MGGWYLFKKKLWVFGGFNVILKGYSKILLYYLYSKKNKYMKSKIF